MATSEDLRGMALSLQGTVEAPHFDRAAFRAARIYVTLAPDGRTANFKFTPDEQEFKCMLAPDAFSPVPNAWGRQGRTAADLSKLGEAELRSALETAWALRCRSGGGSIVLAKSRGLLLSSLPGLTRQSIPSRLPAGCPDTHTCSPPRKAARSIAA